MARILANSSDDSSVGVDGLGLRNGFGLRPWVRARPEGSRIGRKLLPRVFTDARTWSLDSFHSEVHGPLLKSVLPAGSRKS